MSDDKNPGPVPPPAIAPRTPVPRPPAPPATAESFSLPEPDPEALTARPDFDSITAAPASGSPDTVRHGAKERATEAEPTPARPVVDPDDEVPAAADAEPDEDEHHAVEPDEDAPADPGADGSAVPDDDPAVGDSPDTPEAEAEEAVAAPPAPAFTPVIAAPASAERSGDTTAFVPIGAAAAAGAGAAAAPGAATTSAAPSGAPSPGTTSDAGKTPAGRKPASAGPRKVRLAVARVDPWSVMKLSFLLSVAAGIMLVVATWVFWYVLNDVGVFSKIDDMISSIAGGEAPVDILQYVERDRVVSLATIIAVIDVVLLTALATVGAFLYNVVAALVGGLHLTLTDD
ncbi:MAG: DUF3566 domain-containing protein [Cellulomonadaceae bacterium]